MPAEKVQLESTHVYHMPSFQASHSFLTKDDNIFNIFKLFINRKHFFDNFGAIMLFALVGTTISTFIVGGVMYATGLIIKRSLRVKFLDAMYFGAIISATDPVTVLAIFHVRISFDHSDVLN
jgi:NhaP-type Na+/H+ or K+/H+ antiporter